jgi:LuxR family maltose regulon positive regulatory protein
VLAEPEGYIRVFVDEGKPMVAMLQRVSPFAYVKKILAAFPSTDGKGKSAELIEALSERELEVLRLLARGLKYAEIAEQLFVTVSTVRFQIKSIYGKMNVDKQSKAIERARELALIDKLKIM